MDLEVKKIVKEIYGIDVFHIEKINRGSAEIYLIDNKYILKIFQSKYKKEDIDKEIVIINHLKKDGIKVPTYIKGLDNSYNYVYQNRVIVLEEYIKGYIHNNNDGSYKDTIECAEVYGKILKSMKSLPINLPISNIKEWYSKDSFDKSIKKHLDLIKYLKEDEVCNKIKKDILEKIDMLKALKELDYSDMDKMTISNTHGDFNVQQFIYDNNHIKAVIDFVSAVKMPIAWEIIRSYSYIDKYAKDGIFNIDILVDYVKKIMEYFNLNKYDLKYMSYIYLLQILNSTYGYKEYLYNKDTRLLEFAYLRTNICRYLYKNRDIISSRLEEIILWKK